jgi:hypothetical protein
MFAGVSHPLDYTDDGGVREEPPERLAMRLEAMRRAGVQWILCDVPFPFEDRIGRTSAAYAGFAGLIASWNAAGFKVLGVTPYPAGFAAGWKIDAGRPGSRRFMKTYEEACRFLARELAPGVSTWLVANQLNLERFRRPLSERQALEFAARGGAGLKSGSPSAQVGVNMFGFDEAALRMYAALYPNRAVEFDYVGTNGFFGTFDPGGPREWVPKLALLRALTARPAIVLECGFASRGEVMVPAERASGVTHHVLKKLPHVWGAGHTPEVQARYLEEAFWVFSCVPGVLGAFWFCWSDRRTCWNCGQADCPAGTSNGLVDVDENPKPAYEAFARASRGSFDAGVVLAADPAPADDDPARARLGAARLAVEAEALRRELAELRRLTGRTATP